MRRGKPVRLQTTRVGTLSPQGPCFALRRPCGLRAHDATLMAMLAALAALAASGCSSPTGPGVIPPPIDPPTVSCPDPQTLTAPNGIALSFSFETPIAQKGTPPVTTTCSPPSGFSFPVGETTVTCTATDAVQRAAACTFLVTVKAPPHLLLTRFVAFGDSITWGEDGTNPPTTLTMPGWVHQSVRIPQSQQYPDVLQQELAARYMLQTPQVDNAGQRGEEVRDPATPPRFSIALSGHDVVLLMEGSNDVNEQNATILPASIANLRQMLRDAKGRGLRPYLATIPPENPTGFRGVGAALVPGFNDQIRSLAASENVPLVDIYQALNTDVSTFIGFDGLHPTVAGYAKIANVFFSSIMQTLEGPGATTVRAPWTAVATPRSPVRGSKPTGARPAPSAARRESRP
jgi:lysophospholipase L1-like esterase